MIYSKYTQNGLFLFLLITIFNCLLNQNFIIAQTETGPDWIIKKLFESGAYVVPSYSLTSEYDSLKKYDNLKGMFYDGLPYHGKLTKVFCWYGIPENYRPGEQLPAAVLVHGGGMNANPDWVKQWTDRGYAAISMALEGQLPGTRDTEKYPLLPNYPTHEFSGPYRNGFFLDIDSEKLEDQWFFHAVTDVILAHNLIRSFKEIDSSKTGITGISWGGIITCVIAGIDHRYKFAIPVYGCGYLHESPLYKKQLQNLSESGKQFYLANWEPSLYIHNQSIPMLYVNGTNDCHFTMNSYIKSFNSSPNEKYLRIEHNMPHGGRPGWTPEEIYFFAGYICLEEIQPIKITHQIIHEDGTVYFHYQGSICQAKLYYTTDTADWNCNNYEWIEKEALVNTDEHFIVGSIPPGTQYYFVNGITDEGYFYSAPMEKVKISIEKPDTTHTSVLNIPVNSFRNWTSYCNDRIEVFDPYGVSIHPPGYPEFRWDHVPVCIHFGKRSALTDEELRFVASHSDLVCLEKGHGLETYGSTEKGIEHDAIKLKTLNPKMKVIFYWNTFLDYPLYEAHEVYDSHPEWWLKTMDGSLDLKQGITRRYDLSNPEVRDWWTDVAKKGVVEGSCDGVFMDAFPQIAARANIKLWGQAKYDSIQYGLITLINLTRQKLGEDKILLFNGIRNTKDAHEGMEYLEYTDAAMIEHFGYFFSSAKEQMAEDIDCMIRAGKMGKIIVMKCWPGFAWIDEDLMKLPYNTLLSRARENITFPLACFLVAMQPYSYLCYSWGYRDIHGSLDWYPEFDKPLGKPKGDAIKNGWQYNREFEHCKVWLDLETKEARIEWEE